MKSPNHCYAYFFDKKSLHLHFIDSIMSDFYPFTGILNGVTEYVHDFQPKLNLTNAVLIGANTGILTQQKPSIKDFVTKTLFCQTWIEKFTQNMQLYIHSMYSFVLCRSWNLKRGFHHFLGI